MTTPLEILQAAALLPEAERVFVVEGLLESLGPESDEPQAEIDRAWREEVRERCRQVSSGQVEPVSWKQVQADAEGLFDGGN